MFSIGINFFPGSPQSVSNVQTYATPTMFIHAEEAGAVGAFGVINEEYDGTSPILDEQGNPIYLE